MKSSKWKLSPRSSGMSLSVRDKSPNEPSQRLRCSTDIIEKLLRKCICRIKTNCIKVQFPVRKISDNLWRHYPTKSAPGIVNIPSRSAILLSILFPVGTTTGDMIFHLHLPPVLRSPLSLFRRNPALTVNIHKKITVI